MDENLLEQHYRIKSDYRYHCNHCGYNTQLVNRAMSHLLRRHGEELETTEEQPEMVAEWFPEESVELESEDKE